jgi:hypothetical protein
MVSTSLENALGRVLGLWCRAHVRSYDQEAIAQDGDFSGSGIIAEGFLE